MSKLSRIVAHRHGLTPEEAGELTGTSLAELTSHARHLVARRSAVDAAATRHPEVPEYVIEGAYDGGGVRVDPGAGREVIADMLSDYVRGGGTDTRAALARVGRSALGTAPRDEEAEARRERITHRLGDAGYGEV